MIDFLWNILTDVWTYFFQTNAPLTIFVSMFIAGSTYHYRQKERTLVQPLVINENARRLLQLQMDLADDTINELHAYLYGLYRHERRLAMEAGGVADGRAYLEMDWQTFMHSLQLWGVVEEIKTEIRKFFRENHLAERSTAEFTIYKDMRKRQIWSRMIKAMNSYWFSGMGIPSRSDIYDVHEDNKDKIFEIIDRVFDEGRDIAIQYRDVADSRKKTWSMSDFIKG